jgi:hypothetical protein
VIPFAMVVLDVLGHGQPQVRMMPAELPFLVIGLIRGTWSPSSPPFVFAVRPNVANQLECEELSSRQFSAALMLGQRKREASKVLKKWQDRTRRSFTSGRFGKSLMDHLQLAAPCPPSFTC